MKNLRQLCALTILMLTLAVSAFAGQVDCPAAVDPPPSPEATATGQVDCPALAQAAVSLIQSLLSLP
jgi:hypothetical protein